jgi:hypothetical protein
MFEKKSIPVTSLIDEMAQPKPLVETSNLFKEDEPAPQPNEPKKNAPPLPELEDDEPIDLDSIAGFIVDGICSINETVLVKYYEKQVLKDVDKDVLNTVMAKLQNAQNGVTISIEAKEIGIVKTINKVKDFEKKAQLTPQKKKKLEKSTAKYLHSLNIQNDLPPGKALLLSLAMIEGPVLLPLAMSYINNLIEEKPAAPALETKKEPAKV